MAESRSIGKLISIIHRKSHVYFQQKLDPLKLSSGQVKIFMYLKKYEGATQQEITDFFQLDKSSTSFLISKMADRGFVRKEPNPDDRRSNKLYLTDTGIEKQEEVKEIFQDWTELLLKGFSPEEQDQAFDYLFRMIDNVNFLEEDQENDHGHT